MLDLQFFWSKFTEAIYGESSRALRACGLYEMALDLPLRESKKR